MFTHPQVQTAFGCGLPPGLKMPDCETVDKTVPEAPRLYTGDAEKHEGWCSGDWTLGMVSDELVVPAGLRPGRYVLSWRMDCEETAQVWSSCADVEIVASNATAP